MKRIILASLIVLLFSMGEVFAETNLTATGTQPRRQMEIAASMKIRAEKADPFVDRFRLNLLFRFGMAEIMKVEGFYHLWYTEVCSSSPIFAVRSSSHGPF